MNQEKHQLRTDREALVAELLKAGVWMQGNKAKCPFHDDRHPSANIRADRNGVWRLYCHASCKKSWDIFDVREAMGGKPVGQQLRSIATPQRHDPKPREKTYASWREMVNTLAHLAGGEPEHVFPYKGLQGDEPVMLVIRIRTPEGKTFRQGRPVGGGRWVASAPKPAPLFKLPEVVAADSVLVCEGEKASIEAWRAMLDPQKNFPPSPDGRKWAVTTSSMGARNGHHTDWSPLSGKDRVVLWPDHDKRDPRTGRANGETHMQEVAELLRKLPNPPKEIAVVDVAKFFADDGEPDGQDIVEFLAKYAEWSTGDLYELLIGTLGTARPLDAAADLHGMLEDTLAGRNRNIPFGRHKSLTRMVQALTPETCTLIVGGEGSGKSLFVMDLVRDWVAAGVRVQCLMLEKRREFHLERAMAQMAGKPEFLLKSWQEENPDEVRRMWASHRVELNALAPHIECPPIGTEVTYPWVLKWLNQQADQGRDLLIVDPITKVLKSENRTDLEDHRFMLGVEQLLQRTRSRVILVNHTVKGGKVGGKAATGSDAVAGGAAFSRFSDSLLLFQVLEAPKVVTITGDRGRYPYRCRRFLKAQKSRNGPGDKAEFAMFLDPASLRWQEQGVVVRSKQQTPEGMVEATDAAPEREQTEAEKDIQQASDGGMF